MSKMNSYLSLLLTPIPTKPVLHLVFPTSIAEDSNQSISILSWKENQTSDSPVITTWSGSARITSHPASTFRPISSVQFSRSVMSDSLQPHGPQHARLPCPSPTPGAYSNSCPSNQWCHPTISSSVILFSSHLQSFPASGSFPMNQFFTSGGQSIGVSVSAWVLPVNIQDWFPLGWTGWISLQSKRLKSLLQCLSSKDQFFSAQLSLESNSHIHTWLLEIT